MFSVKNEGVSENIWGGHTFSPGAYEIVPREDYATYRGDAEFILAILKGDASISVDGVKILDTLLALDFVRSLSA